MTRPKADSDPWLTDPISRDRVIAKTVVEGMRTIITLLRGIRDQMDETRSLREENRILRSEMADLARAVTMAGLPVPHKPREYPECEIPGCALPFGHNDPHRPSLHAVAAQR